MYFVTHSKTKEQAAAKIFSKDALQASTDLRREAALHSRLNHPNIIELKGYADRMPFVNSKGKKSVEAVLFTEIAAEGDFISLLENHSPLPDDLTHYFFNQMLGAVEYMHGQKICHRDIKPENFLVDKSYNIKLADFGFAVRMEKDETFKEKVGTSNYLPPEVHARQPYNGRGCDLFGLGILLFLMTMGHCPFVKADAEDKWYTMIAQKQFDIFWRTHETIARTSGVTTTCSAELKELIQRMISKDPEDRLTIEGIRSHPWSRGRACPKDKVIEALSKCDKSYPLGKV